jgi:hypothetical protein
MATAATQISVSPETVLAAMVTMRGPESSKKKVAMDYLTKFQKSVRAKSPFVTRTSVD